MYIKSVYMTTTCKCIYVYYYRSFSVLLLWTYTLIEHFVVFFLLFTVSWFFILLFCSILIVYINIYSILIVHITIYSILIVFITIYSILIVFITIYSILIVFITIYSILIISVSIYSIRKKQNMMESLSGMVFGQKMDLYTPAELHSEIFYAECNMLLSLLTFFQVS